jgi:hypothetical protein
MHACAYLQQNGVFAMLYHQGMQVKEKSSGQKRFAINAAPFQLTHASEHVEYAFPWRQSLHF